MFARGAFDRAFMGPLGQAFGYRPATKCPCFDPNSGAGSPTCPICASKGWFWSAEQIDGCTAGITNQTQQKGFAAFGQWSPGDAQLTIPGASAMYCAGHMDRFRCLDAVESFSTNLTRDGSDLLLGTMQAITGVCWIDPTNPANLIQGGLPSVDTNGALTWARGEPPAGIGYTLSGVRYIEYFAWLSTPSMRDIGQVQGLPKKLPVRRFDLFGR